MADFDIADGRAELGGLHMAFLRELTGNCEHNLKLEKRRTELSEFAGIEHTWECPECELVWTEFEPYARILMNLDDHSLTNRFAAGLVNQAPIDLNALVDKEMQARGHNVIIYGQTGVLERQANALRKTELSPKAVKNVRSHKPSVTCGCEYCRAEGVRLQRQLDQHRVTPRALSSETTQPAEEE